MDVITVESLMNVYNSNVTDIQIQIGSKDNIENIIDKLQLKIKEDFIKKNLHIGYSEKMVQHLDIAMMIPFDLTSRIELNTFDDVIKLIERMKKRELIYKHIKETISEKYLISLNNDNHYDLNYNFRSYNDFLAFQKLQLSAGYKYGTDAKLDMLLELIKSTIDIYTINHDVEYGKSIGIYNGFMFLVNNTLTFSVI